MTTTFTISDRDYSKHVDLMSIDVTDSTEAKGDQLTFTVVMNSSDLIGDLGTPRPGEVVTLAVDGIKHFEGVLLQADQTIHVSIDNYAYECKAAGYTYFLASSLVSEEIASGIAGEIVRYLVRRYAPGFGIRYVRDGFTVPEQEFDHVSLDSVLNTYAQAIGFGWYVDFDREVHFTEGVTRPGPIEIIDLDTEIRLGDVSVNESVAQLRNRLYIKDATTRSAESRTDTFISDGQQAFFRLFSPPYDEEGVQVYVNGEPVNVFLDPLTSQDGELEGAEEVCFLCIFNQGLRFPLGDIPEEGDLVSITYYPEDGGGDDGIIITMEDPDSIRMMRQRESRSGFSSTGIHEAILSVPEMRVATLDPLSYLGGIALDRYAWPEITGSFNVANPAVQGWRAGQTTTLRSTKRDLYSSRSFWKRGVREDVLVFIDSTSKRFKAYRKPDATVAMLFEEKISFTNVPARITI